MYRKIVKLPEPQSYYLVNGVATHSLAEQYLLGKIEKLPPVLGKFRKEFQTLLDAGAIPEEEYVLDKDWQLIPDGWKDNNAWLRLKLDARIDNFIVDFKTGKVYDDHIHQGRLYANVLMMLHPEYDEVEVEFWYLNSGQVVGHRFDRRDLSDDIGNWHNRVLHLHTDTEFKPTPHEWCKYCYVKHLCTAYQ
jgi:hypothetical protein